jgi:hypothetical protein
MELLHSYMRPEFPEKVDHKILHAHIHDMYIVFLPISVQDSVGICKAHTRNQVCRVLRK